ncbi:MAG: acetate kinase [Pantoea sp. Brub]|nr:acetate kinase [Pantoea sp. Brub]
MSNELILVLNCGSSSIKFTILNPYQDNTYLSGLAECINLPESKIKWKFKNQTEQIFLRSSISYQQALNFIINKIIKKNFFIVNEITAIGHRIVHGGKILTKSTIITNNIIEQIKKAKPFAPLHIPAHLIGINQIIKHFPNIPNVAVFDTTFHNTIPESSYLYALPYKFYKKHGIRRYGAHGISHLYVTHKTSAILQKSIEKLNIITCHLGNGSSISAIRNGICVDTSMGLTPLEGLVMGTRSGDIDPAIIFFLYKELGMSINNIYKLLTKESGLLGLSEITNDCRYIEENYEIQKNAKRAMDVFCHRIAKYIGGYITLMDNDLDAIVFTGGIGENSAMVRKLVVQKLKLLNFEIDHDLNLCTRFGQLGYINKTGTRLALVIPTNEELIIAKETAYLIK